MTAMKVGGDDFGGKVKAIIDSGTSLIAGSDFCLLA